MKENSHRENVKILRAEIRLKIKQKKLIGREYVKLFFPKIFSNLKKHIQAGELSLTKFDRVDFFDIKEVKALDGDQLHIDLF